MFLQAPDPCEPATGYSSTSWPSCNVLLLQYAQLFKPCWYGRSDCVARCYLNAYAESTAVKRVPTHMRPYQVYVRKLLPPLFRSAGSSDVHSHPEP